MAVPYFQEAHISRLKRGSVFWKHSFRGASATVPYGAQLYGHFSSGSIWCAVLKSGVWGVPTTLFSTSFKSLKNIASNLY